MVFDKRKYSVAVIVVLFLLIRTASVAQAALVQGTMLGFIAENSEARGEGINVFGLDGAGLLGQSFKVDFYYRTDIAPVTGGGVGAGSARTIYDSSDAGLDWLGLALTVNNIKFDVVGSNRHADIIDIFTDPNLGNTDGLQLAVEGDSGPFDGISFRRQFLDISVALRNDILDGAVLPTALSSSEIERVFNSAVFSINDFDFDADTGELVYERYVNFNLDVQSIEAAVVVPIPGSIWLFGSALVGFIVTIRKKI